MSFGQAAGLRMDRSSVLSAVRIADIVDPKTMSGMVPGLAVNEAPT